MSKKINRGFLIGASLLVFSITLLATSSAFAVEQLSMGTATVGGTFYNIGGPLAQCVNNAMPEVNITAEFTQGSTENLRLIQKKKMQLAIITPMIGYRARMGLKQFKGTTIEFKAVVRLLPNSNVWVALKKSKINSIPEVKGYKVAVGPASGGLGVIARGQLKANDIDYKKDIKPFFLGAGDMAQALKDGAVEAAFLTVELAKMVNTTHPVKVLQWGDGKLDAFLKTAPFFGKYTHPANSFKGVPYAVPTVDNGIQLICAVDMDEALVYKLTKTIIENLDCIGNIYAPIKNLTPEWAASEIGNPFHPGAIKYFKEKGLMK